MFRCLALVGLLSACTEYVAQPSSGFASPVAYTQPIMPYTGSNWTPLPMEGGYNTVTTTRCRPIGYGGMRCTSQ